MIALLRNPDERKRLQQDPTLMPTAVDEFLRFDGPIQLTDRAALSDCEIAGQPIRKGQLVGVVLAAANRDPAVYPEPNRFDIERADTHHQAFGGGRHFCLGAHLARLEAAETLAALLVRFPTLELGEGGHAYAAIPSFRGLKHLFVSGGR